MLSEGWQYSQFSHVLGNASGEGAQPPVTAPHHRLHAGALLRAERAQLAATLVIACGEPQSERGGRPASLLRRQVSRRWAPRCPRGREARYSEPEPGTRSLLVSSMVEGKRMCAWVGGAYLSSTTFNIK